MYVQDLLNNKCNAEFGKISVLLEPNEEFRVAWNPKKVSRKCFDYRDSRTAGRYKLMFSWFIEYEGKKRTKVESTPFEIRSNKK